MPLQKFLEKFCFTDLVHPSLFRITFPNSFLPLQLINPILSTPVFIEFIVLHLVIPATILNYPTKNPFENLNKLHCQPIIRYLSFYLPCCFQNLCH